MTSSSDVPAGCSRRSGSSGRSARTTGAVVVSKSTIEREVADEALRQQPEKVERAEHEPGRDRDPGPGPDGRPPRDREHRQREHDDDLAAGPPPALHRERDEGGVEPAGGERERQRRPAGRAAVQQRGERRDASRNAGCQTTRPKPRSTSRPARRTDATGVVRRGADDGGLAAGEVGAGRRRRSSRRTRPGAATK